MLVDSSTHALYVRLLLCYCTPHAQISYVLMALKLGSKGTQACSEAISTIMGIVGELETTAMFAAAGALYSDAAGAGGGRGFAEHRVKILEEAKVCPDSLRLRTHTTCMAMTVVCAVCRFLLKTPNCWLVRQEARRSSWLVRQESPCRPLQMKQSTSKWGQSPWAPKTLRLRSVAECVRIHKVQYICAYKYIRYVCAYKIEIHKVRMCIQN